MVSNRFLGSIGNAIDSAASGTFLAKRASGPVFETLDYSDISDYPTGADVDSAAIINLIDSNFLSTRTPGTDITTVITDSGLNHIVPDSAGEVVKIGNYSKGISNVFADSGTTIKISSHTIALSTDHILFDGGTAASDYSGGSAAPSFAWGGDRGFVVAGLTAGNAIDYYNITTPGNATNFGSIRAGSSHQRGAGVSNGTRGVFNMGFSNISGSTVSEDQLEYITCATTGNSTSFGNLTVGRYDAGGHGDGTYGVFGGGVTLTNVIDYITVASTGNATDFGDLATYGSYSARGEMATAGDATRTIFGGGADDGSGTRNYIQYVTTATPGNGTDFGDMDTGAEGVEAASDATYTLFFGGNHSGSRQNTIQYITTQTAGNTTDFGDLTAGNAWGSASSNGTYAVNGFGYTSSFSNVMNYVTIATPGNAQDFGDLVQTAEYTFQGFSGNAA